MGGPTRLRLSLLRGGLERGLAIALSAGIRARVLLGAVRPALGRLGGAGSVRERDVGVLAQNSGCDGVRVWGWGCAFWGRGTAGCSGHVQRVALRGLERRREGG